MADPEHHLLNLPREIRNEIYQYLWQDMEEGWFRFSRPSVDLYCTTLQPPILNVLLIHPQITAECYESACFRNVQCGLHFDVCNLFENPEPSKPWRDNLQWLLSHAHDLEITVDEDTGGLIEDPIKKVSVWRLLGELQKLPPTAFSSMEQIKVKLSIDFDDNVEFYQLEQNAVEQKLVNKQSCYYPPPSQFKGLSLAACAHGYHVATRSVESPNTVVFYLVVISTWVFAHHPVPMHLLSAEEIIESFQTLGCDDCDLMKLCPSLREEVARIHLIPKQWTIFHGADVWEWETSKDDAQQQDFSIESMD